MLANQIKSAIKVIELKWKVNSSQLSTATVPTFFLPESHAHAHAHDHDHKTVFDRRNTVESLALKSKLEIQDLLCSLLKFRWRILLNAYS